MVVGHALSAELTVRERKFTLYLAMELLMLLAMSAAVVSGWFVCPPHCKCVRRKVDCSRTPLMPTYLPQYVEDLDLSNNDLRFLPSVLYIPQTLVHLDLSDNQLHNIPEKSLEHLWMLRSLNLSRNKIYRVVDVNAVIHRAKKLSRLDLSRNPLMEIGGEKCPRDVEEYNRFDVSLPGGPTKSVDFNELRNDHLTELDMSNCDVTRINMCSFAWLANLTRLRLSENPIKQLGQFKSATLQHLEMSNCGLLYVTPNALEELPSLQFLDVSNNPNLKFHVPFGRIGGSRNVNAGVTYMSKSLLYLNAKYCGLTELFVSYFPNLHDCSFKGNLIREVPPRSFYHNWQLTTVDLSENLIFSTNNISFLGGESLTSVDLSLNFIAEFQQSTFAHMLSLTRLNVSRNPLKSIANISAPNLSVLDASDCDISELPAFAFFNLREMTSLNLSNNPLESLPDEMTSFRLVELDLSYCRVSAIKPSTFKNMLSLKRLDLRGNRLTNPFRGEVIASMVGIVSLRVTNNPWQCNCNGTRPDEFLKFVAERSDDVSDEEESNEGDEAPSKQSSKELSCHRPDTYLQMLWSLACHRLTVSRGLNGPERQWMAFIVTFAVVSSILIVLLVLRQNLMSDENAARQQPAEETTVAGDPESHTALLTASRPVRSPIADILQLPTYEEAILLPKPPVELTADFESGTREVGTWISTENVLNDDHEVTEGNDDEDDCSLCNRQNIQNTSRAVSSTSL